jgi:nitrogen fixation NifU-like protein
MSDSTLYQQAVLEHYRQPRNRGALPACTHASDGANPLCGDRLRIELVVADGRVGALGFTGEACAIATATMSMLAEIVQGQSRDAIAAMEDRFAHMLESGDEDHALGALNAMRELQRYPGRRKCALLPWATLRAALAGNGKTTTETESA